MFPHYRLVVLAYYSGLYLFEKAFDIVLMEYSEGDVVEVEVELVK